MAKYRKRIADDILALKLSAMGAVLVEGAKWCGKTATGKHAYNDGDTVICPIGTLRP